MQINWKIRLQSKTFWTSMVALLVVLANQIAVLFNVDITIYNDQITGITETVLLILGLLGIIVDPTTSNGFLGMSDSEKALTYEERKKDE